MSSTLKVNTSNFFTDVTHKTKLHLKDISGILLITNNKGNLYAFTVHKDLNELQFTESFLKCIKQYVREPQTIKFVVDDRLESKLTSLLVDHKIKHTGVSYSLAGRSFEVLVKCQDKKILVAGVSSSGKSISWKPKVKVLVIDDSSTIRKILIDCIEDSKEFEVIGEAENGQIGYNMIKELAPDIITLDINMPILDGHGLLKKISTKTGPTTLLISSITKGEGETVMKCLEEGAFDYIQKPHFKQIDSFKVDLFEKLSLAEESRREDLQKQTSIKTWQGLESFSYDKKKILTIGASTGGTEAIKEVLLRMPKEIPPTFIVQHIPPVFSAAFAKKLNDLCPFTVVEAEDGMVVEKNTVYVAPGGKHLGVSGHEHIKIRIDEETDLVSGHKPSVDYMYENLLKTYRPKDLVAVILTGMGSDGARGLKAIKDEGGYTIGQDEQSSVVYGMPKKAFENGGTTSVLPLHEIAKKVMGKLKG